MKKSEIFPVLVGYASSLHPNTILDIEVVHRHLADKLNINVKPSTLKQYFTLMANAGFSIKKKRVTREKEVYFVVGDRARWPFKQTLSEVKEMSVTKGSTTVELVPSRKDLGVPLISVYKRTEFDESDSVTEVKEEKDWYDIDLDQISNDELKEILIAVKIGDREIGGILRQVLADTFSQMSEMIFALANYEKELTTIRRYKTNLEREKKEFGDERIEFQRQFAMAEQKVTACESNISVLETMKADLSEKLLKEQDRSLELEKRISELQRDKENLEKRLRGFTLDKTQKFATIGEMMEAQSKKGG